MLTTVQDTLIRLWTQSRKIKTTPSGWISGNAPCCVHQGERADTKGRGGMMVTQEGGVTYHCFNCHYTTGWRPGRGLGLKFRALLKWMNVPESELNLLRFETLKYVQDTKTASKTQDEITFEARTLPTEAKSFSELTTWYTLAQSDEGELPLPQDLNEVIVYADSRGINLAKYNFYWTPQTELSLNRRLIVPFYYKKVLQGYTARAIDADAKPKYLSNHPSHFVFNLDEQTADKKFVIVTEGPFDAMSIDGVALLGSELHDKQIDLIRRLDRRVIVVPDADKAGRKLIGKCLEQGWEISFPVWQETCKDVNEAVLKYGKLFTLKTILDGSLKSKLRVELKLKGLS